MPWTVADVPTTGFITSQRIFRIVHIVDETVVGKWLDVGSRNADGPVSCGISPQCADPDHTDGDPRADRGRSRNIATLLRAPQHLDGSLNEVDFLEASEES